MAIAKIENRSSRTPSQKDYEVALAYLAAKEAVITRGYWPEVLSVAETKFHNVTETDFLREFGWVVLSAGLSERVVRSRFADVSRAFFDWRSAKLIHEHRSSCIACARIYFDNPRKLEAITTTARIVLTTGFHEFYSLLSRDPISTLMTLPFMGPATSRHLAKNVGLEFAKPDRHLIRIATGTQYDSVDELCRSIASVVGDSIQMVDSVLWRYAALNPTNLEMFWRSHSAHES